MSKVVRRLELCRYLSGSKCKREGILRFTLLRFEREKRALVGGGGASSRMKTKTSSTRASGHAESVFEGPPFAIGSDPRTHNYTLVRRESEREGERDRERDDERRDGAAHGSVHAQHLPTRRASRHEEFRSLIYSWSDPAVVHRGVRFDCASL